MTAQLQLINIIIIVIIIIISERRNNWAVSDVTCRVLLCVIYGSPSVAYLQVLVLQARAVQGHTLSGFVNLVHCHLLGHTDGKSDRRKACTCSEQHKH